MSPEELQKYVTVVSPLFDKIGQSGEKLLQLASNYAIARGVSDVIYAGLVSFGAGILLKWGLPQFKKYYTSEKAGDSEYCVIPAVGISVAGLLLIIAALYFSSSFIYFFAPEVSGIRAILEKL